MVTVPRLRPELLADRRRAILDGARRAFARHGYEGATVRVLEAEIGMSRGAIFHHFPDKDALFLALAEQDAEEMAAIVADRGLVEVMRGLRDRDPGWLGVQLEVARRLRTDPDFHEKWTARLERIDDATTARLRRQQAAGIVRDDVPAERLARFLRLVLDGLVLHLATGLEADDLDALLDLTEEAVRKDANAKKETS